MNIPTPTQSEYTADVAVNYIQVVLLQNSSHNLVLLYVSDENYAYRIPVPESCRDKVT